MEPLRIASATNTWSNFMESTLRNRLFYSRIDITPYKMPCQLTTNPSTTQILPSERAGDLNSLAACCASIPAGQFMKHLGVRLILGQQCMARVAILGDFLAVFRLVIAVVAAEAAGKAWLVRIAEVRVAKIVGISSPGDVHFGEDVT